ncbi:hypothetical protein B0H11DRAFT_50429 [Mycena galericulata]|nr:hypothetical protein B0H11DRAFT_50429 [Mycena galericulata]
MEAYANNAANAAVYASAGCTNASADKYFRVHVGGLDTPKTQSKRRIPYPGQSPHPTSTLGTPLGEHRKDKETTDTLEEAPRAVQARTIAVMSVLPPPRLRHPIPHVPQTIAPLPTYSLEALRAVWREARAQCQELYRRQLQENEGPGAVEREMPLVAEMQQQQQYRYPGAGDIDDDYSDVDSFEKEDDAGHRNYTLGVGPVQGANALWMNSSPSRVGTVRA